MQPRYFTPVMELETVPHSRHLTARFISLVFSESDFGFMVWISFLIDGHFLAGTAFAHPSNFTSVNHLAKHPSNFLRVFKIINTELLSSSGHVSDRFDDSTVNSIGLAGGHGNALFKD